MDKIQKERELSAKVAVRRGLPAMALSARGVPVPPARRACPPRRVRTVGATTDQARGPRT